MWLLNIVHQVMLTEPQILFVSVRDQNKKRKDRFNANLGVVLV